MKLIDKDRAIAGIESLKEQLVQGACASQKSMETNCKEEAYNEVLSILDDAEVKEVDFENELDRIWFSNKFGEYFNNDAVSFAHNSDVQALAMGLAIFAIAKAIENQDKCKETDHPEANI